MQHERARDLFAVSHEQIVSLFKKRPNPEGFTKKILYLVGIIASPITVIGALWGYVRAYNRFGREDDEFPTLANLKPISRVAMILGAVLIWFLLFGAVLLLSALFRFLFSESFASSPTPFIMIGVNLILTFLALFLFKRWQANIYHAMQHNNRFGSARWANASELSDLAGKQGLYIGGEIYGYNKQGHIFTCGGTRSGKFVNLIAPNLLGLNGYNGSFFLIDPKGEAAAVTARYQKEKGNRVLILDPWKLNPMSSASYNPLDLVSNQTNPDHLVDDISIIAEMIVPRERSNDPFWGNRARALVSLLILHLVTSKPKAEHTLGTVWKWLRLPENEWAGLLSDMAVSDNEIVEATANEFISLLHSADKTFAGILASASDKTDFLKSPALRASLNSSSFDINTLSDGKTSLFVIIPPDKLDSQSQWLRLVFATSLLAVVRNRNKRVTFILDECAALGFLPQIKTALSTYAGYNITMNLIFQDLSQVKSIYGDAWETFISNSAIRQFMGVQDEFTSSYLEKLIGNQTIVTHDGKGSPNATARPLATADEIRRGSSDNIFTFIEQRPPTYFKKAPYYEMTALYGRYDDNPFYIPTTLSLPNPLPPPPKNSQATDQSSI
ncbi:type IV secretory system conjugative DNA transfer family protein [Chitinophaga barathri]|uniref:Type IV secretory system conjugative DNA transfer family protein n=1 Tax=Chitinophaga barathri TaxID=1647451 RepID=A0A3N4MG04_9BACT|nr:type IV secretory system conjugative DNA transfer family protein [Chitinophaga barathri]RPD40617.1 type IV secretory system conjugative DNA transfer family protein [Chitinophaga barathri]